MAETREDKTKNVRQRTREVKSLPKKLKRKREKPHHGGGTRSLTEAVTKKKNMK